ncbi:uncharacterized protein Eint_100320 [Encephalitozoon intestinalis ATCC 50506]|uniref:Uncharacterized protein n=1 Tax=Encephalitozoon intestinalis (strain ATCC 50506) TaxID=876142 RepID=E0S9H4_ENCIT|nr:uncharacterized protein Eint_100320 [Encephalitozoon intestinalis ATCC 50506]ADM12359.1 hypothetical protein Eint_100320 [Encephalitozoon intestinalis ATCC 50506]UTX46191.1 hypothetical protein GPK93_10g17880 [Encephalitozoon intestinalis]
MGLGINTKSVRGLRRFTRSKTQVIFFDNSRSPKTSKNTQKHQECREDQPAENIPQVSNVLKAEERMFPFEKLLETFTNLEKKKIQKTLRPCDGINPMKTLRKDSFAERYFDSPSGTFLGKERHISSSSQERT